MGDQPLERRVASSSPAQDCPFDADYYLHGPETGKSLYTNYRWMPELTLPMVTRISEYLGIRDKDTVLDFGCARGYIVKALRLNGKQAYGCDISPWAIENADPQAAPYVRLTSDGKEIPFDHKFDWIMAKDVLEHIEPATLDIILPTFREKAHNLFVVVPLGKDGKYICPEYEHDVTHVVREDVEWWQDRFERHGWELDTFAYRLRGIKDNWSHYARGNGFFMLSSKPSGTDEESGLSNDPVLKPYSGR